MKKIEINMKTIAVILAAVLISTSVAGYSQKSDANKNNEKKSESKENPKDYAAHRFLIYYGLGYSNDIYSRIHNDFVSNRISGSHMLEARYAYFFKPKWGLSLGLGVSQFCAKGTLNIQGVFPGYNDPYFDPLGGNREYDLYYKTKDIVEQQKIWAFEIPLQLHYEHRRENKVGIFAGLGVKMYLPVISVQSKFKQDQGVINTMGISLLTFFSIVAGAVVIAAIAGVLFGKKHGKVSIVNPYIDNSDSKLDEVINEDFQIDFED